MYSKVATGNADASGKIQKLDGSLVDLCGTSLVRHVNKDDHTIAGVTVTEITVGGTYRRCENKQIAYQGGYGDWCNVVTIPPGTRFIFEVIQYGNLYSFGKVKVSFPDGDDDLAEKLYQYRLDKLNKEFSKCS